MCLFSFLCGGGGFKHLLVLFEVSVLWVMVKGETVGAVTGTFLGFRGPQKKCSRTVEVPRLSMTL